MPSLVNVVYRTLSNGRFDAWQYIADFPLLKLKADKVVYKDIPGSLAPPPSYMRFAIVAVNPTKDSLPYTLNLLRGLSRNGFFILAIAEGRLGQLCEEILPYCHRLIERFPIGREFGSYKFGFEWCKQQSFFNTINVLMMLNDRMFYPYYTANIVQTVLLDGKNIDWTLGTFENSQYYYHSRSVFQIFQSPVFTSDVFTSFWDNYKPFSSRRHIIHAGEVALTKVLSPHGYSSRILHLPLKMPDADMRLLKSLAIADDLPFRLWLQLKIFFDAIIRKYRVPPIPTDVRVEDRNKVQRMQFRIRSLQQIYRYRVSETRIVNAANAERTDRLSLHTHTYLNERAKFLSLSKKGIDHLLFRIRSLESAIEALKQGVSLQVAQIRQEITGWCTNYNHDEVKKEESLAEIDGRVKADLGEAKAPDRYLMSALWALDKNIPTAYASPPSPPTLMVSVYRGREFLDPFFDSLFQNTTTPYRLIILDNGNDDKEIIDFLKQQVTRAPNALLLRLEENKGYIHGICHAFKSWESGHVVVLNTDTVLPKAWLERIVAPICADEMIASVTPFSNAATVCSFPNIPMDNHPFLGLSAAEIDMAFQHVKPEMATVYPPSGVGFCMALGEKALRQIGFFDAETFGEGYGEENDWCLRASAAGFRNAHVPNLFVYHKHGGIYTPEKKSALIEKNLKIINHKFPGYHQTVMAYIKRDPLAEIRNFIAALLTDQHNKDQGTVLVLEIEGINHKEIQDQIESWRARRRNVLVLKYIPAKLAWQYHFICQCNGKPLLSFSQDELKAVAEWFNIREVVVSSPDALIAARSFFRNTWPTILHPETKVQYWPEVPSFRIIHHDPTNSHQPTQTTAEDGSNLVKTRHVILMITHMWGGGTEKHISDMANILTAAGVDVLICQPDRKKAEINHIFVAGSKRFMPIATFNMKEGPEIFVKVLRSLGINHVHIQNLGGHPKEAPNFFRAACKTAKVFYDVTIHDYMPICPRFHLFDGEGLYCGEPDIADCTWCLQQYGSPFGTPDMKEWRIRHQSLFENARLIFVPNEDVAQRLEKYFPNISFHVRHHPEAVAQPKFKAKAMGGAPKTRRRIAILGAIGPHKGSRIILECALAALRLNLPLDFIIVGHADNHMALKNLPNVKITGRYNESEAVEKLLSVEPDMVWFSSVWPETFSYTLSQTLQAGIFPVTFDFGAIAERLTTLGWGELLPYSLMLDPEALVKRLHEIKITAPPQNMNIDSPLYSNPLESYYCLNGKKHLPNVQSTLHQIPPVDDDFRATGS